VRVSDRRFPYDDLPPAQVWTEAFERKGATDPQGAVRFALSRDTSIGSAGSCFAVRLAERLRAYGMNYYTAEPGPARLSPELQFAYGYRPLSARYGNVYTFLQLEQLLARACGTFVPALPAWRAADGTFVDPFRPHVQPTGFDSIAELEADREAHLRAVREMFAAIDTFIFTAGLIAVWCDKETGAALPRPPGRKLGEFEAGRYELRELDVAQNVAAFESFMTTLLALNPNARVILSVSPVHQIATTNHPHIGRASTYAKATLRVAAETIVRNSPRVDYFASYELVTLPRAGPSAYLPDLRSISSDALEDVMRSFFTNYFALDIDELQPIAPSQDPLDVRPCDEVEVMLSIAMEGSGG
jgi:hypothetical protein